MKTKSLTLLATLFILSGCATSNLPQFRYPVKNQNIELTEDQMSYIAGLDQTKKNYGIGIKSATDTTRCTNKSLRNAKNQAKFKIWKNDKTSFKFTNEFKTTIIYHQIENNSQYFRRYTCKTIVIIDYN